MGGIMTKAQLERLNRRQAVVDCLTEPRNIDEISALVGEPVAILRCDIQHLRKRGIVTSQYNILNPRYGAKVVYMAVPTILKNGEIKEVDFSEYPDFMQKMFGYADVPAGKGQQYINSDKPARKDPLRKINTAWMGYQSGLELA
jgi:hypothetical protein